MQSASAETCSRLRRTPVLAGLKDETLKLILEESEERYVSAGHYFFQQGDDADSFFLILSGNAQVIRVWDSEDIVLGHLGKGDCFGEMALIDLQPRSATVQADTECQVLEIPHHCLRNLYLHDLEQYAIIMMNMGREVSRRLRITDDRLFELEQKLPAFKP